MRACIGLVSFAIVGCSSAGPSDASVSRDAPPDAPCATEDPSERAPYTITFAGAPVSLFGPPAAPRFEEVFELLASSGADAFYPWFGLVDTGGTATIAPHFYYFLPRAWSGGELACETVSPYAAAEGRLDLVFPALLFSAGEGASPFDEAVFRERYASVATSCWAGHEARVVAHQVFDEVAWAHTRASGTGETRPLEDVARAVAILHELDDRPTLLVEAPGPLLFGADTSLDAAERERLVSLFWSAVEQTAPRVDRFGFDVYPVPYFSLGAVGDYVQLASERAPATGRVAVLQAFSYGAESGHTLDVRGPTAAEARFMAFDAIVAGATQLIWYGASALDLSREDDAAVWEGVLSTTRTLTALGPWLGGEEVPLETTGTGVSVFARRAGADGPLTVVLLNRSDTTTEGTALLPRTYDLVRGEDGARPTVEGREVRVPMAPWSVTVLRAQDCP
ncbi:MAG: hypothetical protein U0353_04080 [Sandaracinus sp.]